MVMKSSGSFRLADNVRLAVAVQFKPYVASRIGLVCVEHKSER
jgi:hypothetical protein